MEKRKYGVLAVSLSSHDLALARHVCSLVTLLLSWDKLSTPLVNIILKIKHNQRIARSLYIQSQLAKEVTNNQVLDKYLINVIMNC